MIVRPHVCLRCQLRLSRCLFLSKSQVASISTPTWPQERPESSLSDAEEPKWVRSPRGRHREPLPDFKDRNSTGHEDGSADRRDTRGPDTQCLSHRPMQRVFGHTGTLKRQTHEHLDVESLGEASDVIILKDSKVTYYKPKLFAKVETTDGKMAPGDILEALAKERGLVGHEQVYKNIQAFRPEEGKEPKSWEEFNELVQKLQSSFTKAQLNRYMKVMGEKKGQDDRSNKPEQGPFLFRVSPWIPQIAESPQTDNNHSINTYAPISYTAKQKLVLTLLRNLWNLDVTELEQGIGEFEVELRPRDFELLLGETKTGPQSEVSTLAKISSKYITSKDESIEVFRSHNYLRVKTTRAKSQLISEEIQNAILRIQRRKIEVEDLMTLVKKPKLPEVKKWTDAHFDEHVLDALGKMTRTTISTSNKGKSISISGIEENSKGLSWRTDAAMRLLLTSVEYPDRTQNFLGYRGSSAGMFLQYPVSNDVLSWRDRLRNWTRWSCPIPKEIKPPADTQMTSASDDLSTRRPKQDELHLEAILAKPAEVEPKTRYEQETAHWSNNHSTSSSIMFGNVLFGHKSPPDILSVKSLKPSALSPIPRTFTTTVPNLSRLATSEPTQFSDSEPVSTVKMRFLPNPFVQIHKSNPRQNLGAKSQSMFPPIEMRFSVEPKSGRLELESVRAILSVDNADIMLPELSVDMRFQQKAEFELHLPPPHLRPQALPSGIPGFLAKSNLHLGWGRLETPAKLMMPLKGHLCKDPNFKSLGIEDPGLKMFEVEYLFAGLEIHNTVEMHTFNGWNLRYTSIEAGRAGGRRGELSLWPHKTPGSEGTLTEEEYVQTAFRVAEALDRGAMPEGYVKQHKTKWLENKSKTVFQRPVMMNTDRIISKGVDPVYGADVHVNLATGTENRQPRGEGIAAVANEEPAVGQISTQRDLKEVLSEGTDADQTTNPAATDAAKPE
ncbi:mitochondrial inner-membrane-bound regulator-domain-containing protein [Bisporella sp. PMI_857]|nr:mitochondrial inner-membrane-bound regulator-domain-containing protein [Bisporella sp. PMI_857]